MIVLLDGARRPGAKILVAGGGRCNVTNRSVTADDFNSTSSHVIRRVLAALPVEQTVVFFREIGVTLREEEDGKLFPDTNRAGTVLDALLGAVAKSGVRLLAGHRVSDVECCENGFRLSAGESCVVARCVLLATGGMSLPKTGSDGTGFKFARRLGHSLVEPVPALAPLVLDGDFHRGLSGISHDVELTVRVEGNRSFRMRGPMLWTHFGASGPVILDASRHWHRARAEGLTVYLSVNFRPGEDFAAVEHGLLEMIAARPKVLLQNALADWFPDRFVQAVLAHLGIEGRTPLAHLARDGRRRLLNALLDWSLPVLGSRGFAHAEVTAGGVPLTEVDSATLMSRRCPGLFLAGEILDVDGRIGGFNFQWAWSSAFVAAAGIARWFERAVG